MARSLSSVRAFFQGLDDGTAQKRIDDEAEAKRKKEERDFLFAQTKEERDAAAEGREVISFDAQAAARRNKTAADEEAGQFSIDGAGVRRRINAGKIADATANVDALDATATQRAANIFKQLQNEAKTNEVKQDQLANRIGLVADNPKALDPVYRAQQAQLAASGGDVDKIFAETGITMPPELAGAGIATKIQYLENSGKFLTDEQKARTTTALATEKTNAAAAVALALADANNKSKENIAVGKNTTSTTNTQTRVNAKNLPAVTPAATPARTQVEGLSNTDKFAVINTPPPVAAMPTAPTAPATADTQASPILTPGAKAMDDLKVRYAQLQKEIEALQPPVVGNRSRNGTLPPESGAYLAWKASGKEALLRAKQAELSRLSGAFAPAFKNQ